MRVLVIDDEEEVRELLAKRLVDQCFAVDTASSGTEGSYLARTNDYDLIILDNMLPGKSGPVVCEDIRRTGRSVPILTLSALSDAKRKIELLNAGADDYMVKPYSFDELMARVRALLRRPTRLEGDILTLEDVTLNSKSQTVRRADKVIYLTRKEFMLLEYLLRNQGTVLSRAIIMEHVWDMTSDPFSNTIESHVLSLRRKLEKNGGSRLIHTISGRGYKADSI